MMSEQGMKGALMNRIINIFTAPTKVFTTLKEKPEWVTPFIIVLVVVALSAAITVSVTKEAIIAKQEEMMRERGMTEEQIEQALKVASGPVMVISSTIGAAVFIVIVLLVFAFLTNLLIPLFGGTGAFKQVWSVVCFSALIKVPSAILKVILMAFTKSPYVTTSLALFVPGLAEDSFAYKALAGFDFFIIWEMVLVALGISITNEIEKKNAYTVVFLIWIASIFVGIALGVFGPRT